LSENSRNEPGVRLPGVRRTATGRLRREGDTRVRYEEGGRLMKSEGLVRYRCLRANYDAICLPPSIWRVLGTVERLQALAPGASVLELVERAGARRPRRMARAIETVRAVIPAAKRRAIVERHTSGGARPDRPGTPDLLVYRKRADGTPCGVRFVEVKRGGPRPERLAEHQREELAFLQELDLRAGVLRLEEREASSARSTR
jgi:hypothetical protein